MPRMTIACKVLAELLTGSVRLAALSLCISACAPSREPAPEDLSLACQEHPHAFASVISVLPIVPDSAVAIDPLSRQAGLVDFGRGTFTSLAREGDGPLEIRAPSVGLRLGGDTIAVYDAANARLLLLDGALTPVATAALDVRGPRGAGDGRLVLPPRASDRAGRLYFETPRFTPEGNLVAGMDSTLILRLDRARGRLDTLAQLAAAAHYARESSVGTTRRASIGIVSPWDAADAWTVLSDGRLAVASAAPYRVRIVNPDGSRVEGDTVPTEPLALTEALIAEALAARRQLTARYRISDRDVGSPRATPVEEAPDEWRVGQALPPFSSGAVIDVAGQPWVQRLHGGGLRRPVFDVFDSSGTRTRRVALPLDTRVAAATAQSLYLVRVDADDLQYVNRCDWSGTSP